MASPQENRIGSLPAHQVLAKRKQRDGTTSDLTRWFAQDGRTSYVVQIERVNGRLLQLDLEKQLQAMRGECKPESLLLQVADDAPAASGGNAPKASAGD